MAAPVVYVSFGSRSLPICFSQNALYRLQKESGKTPQLMGLILQAGRGGPVEFAQLLWAGLEGGRLKTNGSPNAFTIDHVGDLVEEAGGFEAVQQETHPVAQKIVEAWFGAFPISKRLQDEAEAKEKAAAAAGNPQPAGAGEVQTPAQTGTSSSTPPPSSE